MKPHTSLFATIAGLFFFVRVLLSDTVLVGQTRGNDSPSPFANLSSDPSHLLDRLKQRDAQFDNRSVQTEQRWTERVSPRSQIAANQFNAMRFGQAVPEKPPEDQIPDDFDQPHRVRHWLTVREPEVTLERLGDFEEMKHPQYVALQNRGFRWSSAGGTERTYSPETSVLHIHGQPRSGGVLRAYQWMFEWCCGYGIAKWMESIDSVHTEGDRLIVEGRLQLMDYDDSLVEMELDRDLIVRRAVIAVPAESGGGFNEYVIRTVGTARPENCPPVAEQGHFQRILKPVAKPESVYQEYDIVFLAASAPLTDAQYAERTRIEPDPDTQIVDMRPRK
jgi:hypothetical protein